MDGNTNVQTLISQFELMAQVNATSAAPRSWSVTRNSMTELPPQPKSDNSPVKEIINRINTQRARTQSEPIQRVQKREQPVKEPKQEEHETKITIPTLKVYKSLSVNTFEHDNDVESTASTTTIRPRCYLTVPRSPSTYSTASTGSLDSLLSSLDMFLPDLLLASRESSPELCRSAKPTSHHSRRSSLPESLQSTRTTKLILPTSYRRASLTGKLSVPAPKSHPNQPLLAPTPARTRRSSSTIPPTAKSTRRFSDSARDAPPVTSSPRARNRSKSTCIPRYMDYDSSPRFMATKARNVERRRQLEERNRSLAADKVKHLNTNVTRKPRTPEWQGRLDQVRSRLFDNKDDNQSGFQSHAVKPKGTAPRRRSTSSHSRS
ncbi:hypothetical protein P3T76_000596 [Phytophthora citrophthora]|uniref:Uncharacterized protein n=1 Tax=Phytophthora citrophthora TaxID=4793 RepID=A0AAD9LTP9_9STRA|nr:hypothetical protein P3T76_000596 [Phytophthora citrophthora]